MATSLGSNSAKGANIYWQADTKLLAQICFCKLGLALLYAQKLQQGPRIEDSLQGKQNNNLTAEPDRKLGERGLGDRTSSRVWLPD